jgi:hypothetical protein
MEAMQNNKESISTTNDSIQALHPKNSGYAKNENNCDMIMRSAERVAINWSRLLPARNKAPNKKPLRR